MKGISIAESEISKGIPLYFSVRAGFASPAEDHYEERLNLNDYLIHKPSTTLIIRAFDNAMYSSGITEGDILIIDTLQIP